MQHLLGFFFFGVAAVDSKLWGEEKGRVEAGNVDKGGLF